MEIIHRKNEVRTIIKEAKTRGKIIGFVPTMGYLHHGHISLIRKAIADGCFTIVSIFVNPLQFGPDEDFQRYPRDLVRDLSMLKKEFVDVVFVPSTDEMYTKSHLTEVRVPVISEKLEGKFRPGHFTGVCTVVAKLFNLTSPDKAYFGWKDAQQLIIIKKMVVDLDLHIEIVSVPTVRDSDGLAASSRNKYLSEQERKKALVLSRALQKIKEMVELENITDSEVLIATGKKIINSEDVELQYLEAVELENLEPVSVIKNNTGILGAIKVGKVRLIDNIIWE
ncbi:MAG: pantoate--beta-alanine ligase [Candidatus Omnitrophica bacterium]|nr:pantoate--beta-alanine ligase [Candidatus Omnitrophota bacterium]MCM8824756.1 pantoate--beta-alanine ligase [Candidatus Omnitrophota bacterium]